MDNANPILAKSAGPKRARRRDPLREVERSWGLANIVDDGGAAMNVDSDELEDEPINAAEIFDLIRSISDPEHPHTLEQLSVVSEPQIAVQHGRRPNVTIEFTPTIPHCSMATLIGLSIRVRLLRSLPDRFKIDIRVKEGSHQSENAVNKQLNDKERVAAALENAHLLGVVQQCLATADRREDDAHAQVIA